MSDNKKDFSIINETTSSKYNSSRPVSSQQRPVQKEYVYDPNLGQYVLRDVDPKKVAPKQTQVLNPPPTQIQNPNQR